MARTLSLLLSALLLPWASINAQPIPDPGVRVRVLLTVPLGDSLTGVVRDKDATAFTLDLSRQGSRRVPLADLLQVDVCRGRATRWVDGVVAGTTVGAVVGLVTAIRQSSQDRREQVPICWNGVCEDRLVTGHEVNKPRSTAIGALVGATIGGVIGAASKGPERWREVWRREARED